MKDENYYCFVHNSLRPTHSKNLHLAQVVTNRNISCKCMFTSNVLRLSATPACGSVKCRQHKSAETFTPALVWFG